MCEEESESEEEEKEEVRWSDTGGEERRDENMLRFFSRRKAKGRHDQKGGQGRGQGVKNKHMLQCNIILLDQAVLSLEISVSPFILPSVLLS